MSPAFCRLCGTALRLARLSGDEQSRLHCPACGYIEYENPRVDVGCLALGFGTDPVLRTLSLRSGERVQDAALRSLGVAAGEDDISLYCALSDRRGGAVCLVFRVSQQVALPAHVAPVEAPAWQRALLARFSRDAAAGRFPVYTAELPAAGEGLLLREVSSS
jgi:ribosomal protein S27AE